MFVRVHKASKSPAANNKGSCKVLADYLDKEKAGEQEEPRQFFNHGYDTVTKGSGIKAIDQNVKGLGKNDNKFFMITINPSHRELQHIIEKTTGHKGITDFTQLGREDQQKVFASLRDYSRSVMDIYAQNFDRPNVRNGADLVYFARIETQRRWHPWDKEVREGKATKGTVKEGLNLHIHVVVSRNDRTQTTKLSPESRSRGGKQQFQGRAVQQGFDHERFKVRAGQAFQEKYDYNGFDKEQYRQRGRRVPVAVGGTTVAATEQVAKRKVKSVAARAMNKSLGGQLATERQVVNGAITAASIAINPASALTVAKNKLIQILKAAMSGKEI